MKNIKKTAIFLLIFISLNSHAADLNTIDKASQVKILFIGNSASYFNSVSQLVKGIAQNKFPEKEIVTKMISNPGIALRSHLRNKNTITEIQHGDWDYVVLQDQSSLGAGIFINGTTSYIGPPDTFFESVRKFNVLITKSGAKTVLFMTWSRKEQSEQQKFLTYAYMTIAKELGILVAPVGIVWDELRGNLSFDVYYPDGAHPSAYGSYLAATTIFSTIFETSPKNAINKINGFPVNPQGVPEKEIKTLVNISKEDAAIIHDSVDNVITALKPTQSYLTIDKPILDFKIPELPAGQSFTEKDVIGEWYGKSGFNLGTNIGLKMDVLKVSGKLGVKLSLYTPDTVEIITAKNVKVENSVFSFEVIDQFNTISVAKFIRDGDKFIGLSKGKNGPIRVYDDWIISKSVVHNGVDLVALAKRLESLNGDD